MNLTVNDFPVICRLCLKKEPELQPIFKSKPKEQKTNESDPISINEIISLCLGLNIIPDDEFPMLICDMCFGKLTDCYAFRRLCIGSWERLKCIKLIHKDDIKLNDVDCFVDPESFDAQSNSSLDDHIDSKADITTDSLTEPTQSFPNSSIEATCFEVLPNVPVKRKQGRPKSNKAKRIAKPRIRQTPEEKLAKKKQINEGICPICGIFTASIYVHKQIHAEVLPECDYCHKTFARKTYLRNHFRIHMNDRNHQCTLCSYKFYKQGDLVRHMRTHTGEKPFKCKVCPKTFTHSSYRNEHEKTHFVNTNIQCPYCDKMFSTKRNLKSHIGIHTGERPFKCSVCGAAFVAGSSLAIHRRTHIKDNVNLNNQCSVCNVVFETRMLLHCHMRDHGINSLRAGSLQILETQKG